MKVLVRVLLALALAWQHVLAALLRIAELPLLRLLPIRQVRRPADSRRATVPDRCDAIASQALDRALLIAASVLRLGLGGYVVRGTERSRRPQLPLIVYECVRARARAQPAREADGPAVPASTTQVRELPVRPPRA